MQLSNGVIELSCSFPQWEMQLLFLGKFLVEKGNDFHRKQRKSSLTSIINFYVSLSFPEKDAFKGKL